MSQTVWDTIVSTTTSGNQLADILNDFKDAVVSGFSGTARPTNLQAGGYWIDITNDGLGYWSYKMYNGTSDIEIFQINKTTAGIILSASENEIRVTKNTNDSAGPKLYLEKSRPTGLQAHAGDSIGDIEFQGNDGTGTEQTQAKISAVSTDLVSGTAQGAYIAFHVTQTGTSALIEAVRITNDGKLGIGVIAPQKDIHVVGSSSSVGVKASMVVDSATGVDFVSHKERTSNSGQVVSGDKIGAHKFESVDNAGTTFEAASLEASANQNHTAGVRGTTVKLQNIIPGAAALSDAISIVDDVTVGRNLVVTGDLTVQGTTVTMNTSVVEIEDATIILNNGGTQATANAQDSGFVVEMSDATNCMVGYDSTLTSKFKAGEVGSESEIIVSAGAQTLNAKSITSPSRLDVKKDTEANLTTYATTASDGQLCFATDTLSAYVIYSGALQAIGGGGVGGINYISNWNAEKDITGWSLYKDADSAVAEDGTGGTATITFAQETASPLFDDASFKISSNGTTSRRGEGISTVMLNIDPAVKYNPISGSMTVRNTALQTGDIKVFIYDVTNAALIRCTYGEDVGASLAGDINHSFGFQATNSLSYRVIIHVATNTTSAFDFLFDNVIVGPAKPAMIGAPITDWKATTMTVALTGATGLTVTAFEKRIGDTAYYKGIISWSAVFTGGTATISLPAGRTIDITKQTGVIANASSIFGSAKLIDSGTDSYPAMIGYSTTTAVRVFSYGDDAGASTAYANQGAITTTAPYTWANADTIEFEFSVPISGWSSGVVMSETTMNREISFIASISTNLNVPTATWTAIPNANITITKDSANMWNGVDGIVIPENGDYQFEMMGALANNATGERYYAVQVNGNEKMLAEDTYPTSARLSRANGSRTLPLVKGDVVKFATYQNSGSTLIWYNSDNYLTARKVNTGSQTIAASEEVYVNAAGNANTALTGEVDNIDFTEISDSHGAWNGTTFTAPMTRKYLVTGLVRANAPTASYVEACIGGSLYRYISTSNSAASVIPFSAVIPMVAGQLLNLKPSGNVTLSNVASTHHLSIIGL